jgi:hypothetical protein
VARALDHHQGAEAMTKNFAPRQQAAICRQFAEIAGDFDIQRRLTEMANAYEAEALKGAVRSVAGDVAKDDAA